MGYSPESHDHAELLRRRAEEAMQGHLVDLDGLDHGDIQFLLHELHVHQVELSMQNDELRRVQLELEISRDQYSDLYNFAPAGYCTLNRKGSILEANQTLASLLGVERERLIRTPLSHYVDRANQDEYYLHRQRALQESRPQVSDLHMVRSSGEKFAVRMESVIVQGDENQVRVMISDITERTQAEEALREARERLRVALENAPINLYTTDRELRYTWIYATKYGFTPEDVLGKRDDDLLPAEQIKELIGLKQAALESGIGQRQEVHFQVKGETRVHDVTVEPIFAEDGKVVGLTVASIDVTDQRRIEKVAQEIAAQREVQHRLLDQREQERQQIARDLHDGVVQELTGVTFALRALLMGQDDPELIQQLEPIQTTLQEQIHELRTYAGELRPPTLAKFGLEQALRSHLETFQQKHPDLRIRLEVHQNGQILQEATALALFRIYQQALVNILKHAQATEILVQFDKNEQQAQLGIQDNGLGFELPEDWLDLVRAGHLGLLGMRERAEAVGGSLNVRSNPGNGTLIQARVPLESSAH